MIVMRVAVTVTVLLVVTFAIVLALDSFALNRRIPLAVTRATHIGQDRNNKPHHTKRRAGKALWLPAK